MRIQSAEERIEALLRVIADARAELAFMADDETDGSATPATRAVRIKMVRDALDGVGTVTARRALGFLDRPATPKGPPSC